MLAQDKFKTILSLIILASAVWLIHGFIPALLWAVVIAIATWPLRVKVAQKTGLNDIGVAAIMTASVAVLLFLPIAYALILAASDLGALTSWIMDTQKSGIAVPEWVHLIPKVGDQAVKWWSANLTDSAGLSIFLGNADNSWIKKLAQNLGTQAAHRLATLVFTIVTLFFLYRHGDDLSRKTLALLEKLTGEMGKRYGLQAATAIRATVNGVVLVGLAEGLVIGVSYRVADAPHAAILGLSTGALAMIPFAAPLIFTGVSVVLMAQGDMVAGVCVFIFSMLVLTIGDHVVRPKIIGSSVELPFLWVLFGILGGVEVFGLIGLFIGPALMALVMMMWSDMTEAES
ncbi:MAG: AI-2E family transporter [Gallionellaceae bacterium]